MRHIAARFSRASTLTLRIWWASHGTMLMRIAVALMAVASIIWLGYQFWRLLLQPNQIGFYHVHPGAIDLKLRYKEVHQWFSGGPVYGELKNAVYPPASYLILWPLLGWLGLTPAIWLWAATTLVVLGWLIYVIDRESGSSTLLEHALITLIPLSMYATGATIGNGQLIVHLLPMILTGLLLLHQKQTGWCKDLAAALLISLALVKPTVSVPFIWIVLFVPGRLKPILLVICGYVAMTLFAALFQQPGFTTLLRSWIFNSVEVSTEIATRLSHCNLHSWLATLGLEQWNTLASLITLAALGGWVYCCRKKDIWLLISVTGIFTRLWTYHGWYDDLLMLPAIIALFRIAKRGASHDELGAIAGILFGMTVCLMIAPGGKFILPPPWNELYMGTLTIIWIFVLIFLIHQTHCGMSDYR